MEDNGVVRIQNGRPKEVFQYKNKKYDMEFGDFLFQAQIRKLMLENVRKMLGMINMCSI